MPGKRGGLVGHALHHVAVARYGVDVVIKERKAGPAVTLGQISLRHGHADSCGEALSQRACGGLYAALRVMLRMPRSMASPLPEGFKVFERQGIPGKMQKRVKKHGAVPGRKHKPVSSAPFGIFRIMP